MEVDRLRAEVGVAGGQRHDGRARQGVLVHHGHVARAAEHRRRVVIVGHRDHQTGRGRAARRACAGGGGGGEGAASTLRLGLFDNVSSRYQWPRGRSNEK